MYCSVCGAGPHSGFPVYRNNPIDEDPPVWRCKVHLDIPFQTVKEGATLVTLTYSLKVDRFEPDQFTIKHIRDLQANLKSKNTMAERKEILIKFRDTYNLTNNEALTLATWDLPKFKKREQNEKAKI